MNIQVLVSLCILPITLAIPAFSAPLIIDAFSEGGFDLAPRIIEGDTDLITPTLVNRRRVTAFGSPFSASLDPSIGIVRYEGSPLTGENTNYLKLDYQNTNNSLFSIASYDAFEFEIPELVGSGYLRYAVNNFEGLVSLPEVFTQPGTIRLPFNYLTTHWYEQPVISVQFYIFPLTSDFSVGVDEIRLVPEPCSAVLLLTGTGLLAARRRRGL